MSDITCTAVTECVDGQYMIVLPTPTSDSVCVDINVVECVLGQVIASFVHIGIHFNIVLVAQWWRLYFYKHIRDSDYPSIAQSTGLVITFIKFSHELFWAALYAFSSYYYWKYRWFRPTRPRHEQFHRIVYVHVCVLHAAHLHMRLQQLRWHQTANANPWRWVSKSISIKLPS